MSSAGEPPSAPEAAAAPVEKTLSLWERLTPDERSFVRKHRITEVCSSLVFSTCMPHWNSSYMDLVKGDTALMARHYGASASIISCFEMFTSPFVASLSDTVGRKYLAAFGRIGWILFFGGYKIRDRSLPFRLWSEVVCWGIVQAGVWSIFAAQHSDIFGERPTLSSEIKAADEMWSSIAKTIGPFLSFACAKTVGSYFSEYLVSAFTAASMVTLLSIPETLMDDRPVGNGAWVVKKDRKPAHRKKFRLATANPFANIALLFRNGPGLRSLATTSTIVFSINEIWSTQGTFRLGVLGWSSQGLAWFDSVYNLLGSFSQPLCVSPLLRKFGTRRAFEIGTLVSALAYFIQSLSIWGPGRLSMSVIYCAGVCLLQTAPAVLTIAGRAMVVKQGISVNKEMGRGQLNAAYGGLGEILAVVTPLVWGQLFSFSQKPPKWAPRILRWGKAGHCLLAGVVFLFAYRVLHYADPKTLFIDDMGEEEEEEEEEEEDENENGDEKAEEQTGKQEEVTVEEEGEMKAAAEEEEEEEEG